MSSIVKKEKDRHGPYVKPYVGPTVMNYTLVGVPQPQSRPRFGLGRVYDCQKKYKFGMELQLKQQHSEETELLFEGALRMDITFFMPMVARTTRKLSEIAHRPHKVKPDLSNLVKLVEDVGSGIIYKDDALIAVIFAQKVYSTCPRTEFTITRLENNG